MILGVSLLFSLFASASAVRTYHSTHGEATGSLRDAPVDGLCDENVKQLSGYYDVKSGVDKHYFFWFFESRSKPSTDPLVIWLTGGPGCSSQLALMTENGPCTASADGKTTVNNPYSWNSNANIMWIDQPANVGYSYSTSKKDEDHNEGDVSEDMYNFLQEFFKAHGEYLPNEFYVFGESYGGHYVPAISSRIYEGNQKKEGVHINLQGLGIGNGLTNPVVQYQYYPEMAMNNSYGIKTVSEEDYAKMVEKVPRCKKMAEACQADQDLCVPADDYCNLAETQPYYKTGLNPYNIKVPCGDSSLCYDFTNVETFLNLESTRQALHVSDDVKSWTECNNKVNAAFAGDWMRKFSEVSFFIPCATTLSLSSFLPLRTTDLACEKKMGGLWRILFRDGGGVSPSAECFGPISLRTNYPMRR
jgi:cathepsin A (carboxypeptidase C)